MELAIIIVMFIGASIFNYFSRKSFIKKKIKKSWGHFPKPKIIDDLDQEELEESMRILRKHFPRDHYIDSYTWQDLEFFKIFRMVNKGYSAIGQDYLYYRLRSFDEKDEELEEFQSIKDFYEKDEDTRRNTEYNLYTIGKNDNFSLPLFIDTSLGQAKDRKTAIYFMGLLPLFCLISSIIVFQYNGRIGIYLFSAFAILGLVNLAYFKSKYRYLLSDIKNSEYLGNFLKKSKKLTKDDLPNKAKIKDYLKSLGKISFWMNFVAVEDTEDPLRIMVEQFKTFFLLPLIAYDQVNKILGDKHKEVYGLIIEVGKIEAAISTLNYEIALQDVTRPTFVDDFKIYGKEVLHPLVKNPVGNDVDLEEVNIITGSNASGKSTYVKSIAINAIFAQTLNFVYARDFALKKAGVFTSMAIKDDVVAGDSYFIAEIKSLKRIVKDAQENQSYYFIDEILKGTNTIERIGASSSIIDYLIERDALAMIASHDIELTSMFGDKIRNIHFREYVKENGDIDFDYKLKMGPSKTRNAIRLLDSMDFGKEIVDKAQKRAEDLTKKKELVNR